MSEQRPASGALEAPPEPAGSPEEYGRIARAIRFLTENRERQPSLEEVARVVGSSPWHFQRTFLRWAGVSPKRFLQFLTVEHAKERLEAAASVLDAALEAGLSGPSRLHDHFVALEAVTPGEFKSAGEGLEIVHGTAVSPFGTVFLAATSRGVVHLAFPEGGESATEETRVARAWPAARLRPDPAVAQRLTERIFSLGAPTRREPISVLVRGTNFQVQVWKALLRIPSGELTTYGRLAQAVGRPGAARAVGGAVGANPVAFLVPCHRVIAAQGGLGGYRWGTERKRALLAWEGARHGAGGGRPAA